MEFVQLDITVLPMLQFLWVVQKEPTKIWKDKVAARLALLDITVV
jgi:hypothetical protein